MEYIRENYETLHGWLVGDDLLTAEGLNEILEPSEYEIDMTLWELAESQYPVETTGHGDGGRTYDTSEFDNETHREIMQHFFE